MWHSTTFSSRYKKKNPAYIFLVLLDLLLAVSQVHANNSAADYFVHSLPGAPEPLLKMHAGHIEVIPEHNGNLFFWHFANRHLADKSRTVIWLNGGPGCSSEDGALLEIGPYRVREEAKLELVNGSWDEFANILFVDNPVGTGFSYINSDSFIHELEEMADYFLIFLEKWFELFPHYSQDDIYIAGESYAGQYIPYIARAILERNKNRRKGLWDLKGLLIGNGWISGIDQYPSWSTFAHENGLIERGSPGMKEIENQELICLNDLHAGGEDHVDVSACKEILQKILRATQFTHGNKSMCSNMYDVRLLADYPSCGMAWPSDLKEVTSYLRRQDVLRALHVDVDKHSDWVGWTECNGIVGSAFSARNSVPSIKIIPDLLAELPIILFSGDRDLICNYKGTEELINNLQYNSGKGFEKNGQVVPRYDWVFEGEPAGIYQSARNLTYIKFYNSSHMVPFDYPTRTRDMLDRFMGVDVAAVGGKPYDSIFSLQTGFSGYPNSTTVKQGEDCNKSGEFALVVVLIAALALIFLVWRNCTRYAEYKDVVGNDLDDTRAKESRERFKLVGDEDLEAANLQKKELGNFDI